MRPRSPRLAWILPAFLLASAAVAGEVGFVEDFALARDRSIALRQLIPGTEDYYFYHALHALQTEQYDQAVNEHVDQCGQIPQAARDAHRLVGELAPAVFSTGSEPGARRQPGGRLPRARRAPRRP